MNKENVVPNLGGIDVADLAEWRAMLRYVPEADRLFVLVRDLPKIISQSATTHAEQVRAETIEECAKLVESSFSVSRDDVAFHINSELRGLIKAIRALGEKK